MIILLTLFLFSLWRLDLVNSVWTVLLRHLTQFVVNFLSRYSSLGSSAVNFFAQILSFEENCYVFPPVGRAIDAVKHLARFKSKGVLIIPVWPRSPWFSWFFPDGRHCAAWVKTLIILNPVFARGIGVDQRA